MKNWIALLLALAMALTLCACGGGSAESPSEEGDRSETAAEPAPEEEADVFGEWINSETGLYSYVFENGGYGYCKCYNALPNSTYKEKDFTWQRNGTVLQTSLVTESMFGDSGDPITFRFDESNKTLRYDGVAYVRLEDYTEQATVFLSDEQTEQTLGRELLRSYQENPVRFTNKGNPVTVVSTVKSIETDQMICYDDNVYTGKSVLYLAGGWCVVTYESNPILPELTVGDTVLVRGVLSGIEKYGDGIIVDNETFQGNSIRLYDEELTEEEQAHNAVCAAKQWVYKLNTGEAFAVLDEAVTNGLATEELTEYYDELTAKCFEGTQYFRPDVIYSYIDLEEERQLDDGRTEYYYTVPKNFSEVRNTLTSYYGSIQSQADLNGYGADAGEVILTMPR